MKVITYFCNMVRTESAMRANSKPGPVTLPADDFLKPLGHGVVEPADVLLWHTCQLLNHSLLELLKV